MKIIYEIFKDTYIKAGSLERERAITRCINKINWCKAELAAGKPVQGKLKSRLNQAIGKNREHRIWQFVGCSEPQVNNPNRAKKWGIKRDV